MTCLLLVLTESYGLRLRHVVAGCYYPRKAKQRAAILYGKLVAGRRSFLPDLAEIFSKNQDAAKVEEKASFVEYLSAR